MSTVTRKPAGRRTAGEDGFTLLEVLITIVVSGVLGGALMTLVVGQQQFYSRSDNELLAQQNIRAAVDLMATELRIAGADDIIIATSDSIVARFDIVRAVICDTLGGGEANAFVYDSIPAVNLPSSFRGTAFSGPYDSAFVYGDSFTPGSTVSAAARTNCMANGADPSGTAATGQFRLTTGWAAEYGVTPPRGSLVRWYGALIYGFRASASDSGFDAIWRNGQELVTPFETGAAFSYVMADGTVTTSVSGSNLANIREIRVVMTATGTGPFNVSRPVTYDIPLRN